MSGGLAKACVPRNKYSVPEKLEFLNVILLLKLILADLPADLPPHHPNASWYIYYGMYLAAILDSSRKGGNFFLFVNN